MKYLKQWKLLLINILIFITAIVLLETTNIEPKMIWEGVIAFWAMEVGYLIGKGGLSEKD